MDPFFILAIDFSEALVLRFYLCVRTVKESPMKYSIFLISIFLSLLFTNDKLQGKWKLHSFDTIDKIRLSETYLLATEEQRDLMEQRFEKVLDESYYHFSNDSLFYSDLDRGIMVTRRALWELNDDVLTIKEIDRKYVRQALIRHVSKDSLVLSLIVEGKAGDGKLVFTRAD